MRWIPELSHSPAAGHRPWPSVWALSQPFKFQLCPQEWLQKTLCLFLNLPCLFSSLIDWICELFFSLAKCWASSSTCPLSLAVSGPHIMCSPTGCSSSDKTPPAPRIPHLYNFVWKDKTRQRAEPDHHPLLLDKSWTGHLQEQPESLE